MRICSQDYFTVKLTGNNPGTGRRAGHFTPRSASSSGP